MVPIWQDGACFWFYGQLCLLFERASQRLTSGRVTEAGNAAEPVSGSETKSPQCLIVSPFSNTKRLWTPTSVFFPFFLLFIVQIEAPSRRTAKPSRQ